MRCRICKTEKKVLVKSSLTKYVRKNGKVSLYHAYSCNPCNTKQHNEWYRKEGNAEKQMVYNKKYVIALKCL